MRHFILSVGLTLIMFASTAEAEETCRPFVENNISKALQVFHAASTSDAQKRQQLNGLFAQIVDVDWVGKTALGPAYHTASEEDKGQFLTSYRAYLADLYVSKFNGDDGMNVDTISIASLEPHADAATGSILARTVIQNKDSEATHVDFVLDAAAGCKVHDISVEGVSMLTGQRSQMAAISAGGMKNVLTALAKHTKG